MLRQEQYYLAARPSLMSLVVASGQKIDECVQLMGRIHGQKIVNHGSSRAPSVAGPHLVDGLC